MQLRARQPDSGGTASFGSWQRIVSPNIASGLNSTQDARLGGNNFVMRYGYICIVRLWVGVKKKEKKRKDFLFLEVKLSSGATVFPISVLLVGARLAGKGEIPPSQVSHYKYHLRLMSPLTSP